MTAYCERTEAGTLDSTLRDACSEPAAYALYERNSYDAPQHYVCSQHISPAGDFRVVGLTYEAVRQSRIQELGK